MAQRKLAKTEVTNVEIPQDRTAEGFNNLADTAMGFVDLEKKKDLANMNDFMADANLQMTKATNDWRIANEADPTNKEALGKLHAGYNQILNQYTDKVGMLSRGTWTQVSNKLKGQYQLDNLQWGQKQTVVNMENRTNDSIDKNLQMFRQLGQTFDINKLRGSYQTSREALENFAVGTVGQAKATEWLKNYHKDSMKMFVYGAAETDPDRALVLLNQKEVQDDIDSPEDMQTLRDIVAKNKSLKDKGIVMALDGNENKMLSDWLLDPSKVDIMTVDNALASKNPQEQIRPQFANYLKKAILSSKTVGAETKDKAFIDLAGSIISTNVKDAKGKTTNTPEDIKLTMLEMNAAGELSDEDMGVLQTFNQQVTDKDILKSLPKKNFMQAITFWSDENANKYPEVRARMFKSYMQKINSGQTPANAVDKVIKEEVLNSHPQAVSYPKEGQKVMDVFGVIKRIFPDGEVKDEEQSQDAF
jgi:mRNA-degrading endonuclease HigB of HigAB toxin-antitoxin module